MERIKSENNLENELLNKLEKLGYKNRSEIKNIEDIQINIKKHIEKLNRDELSDNTIPDDLFESYILQKIRNNTVFENAKLLRDMFLIPKNNNENYRLKAFDLSNIDNNVFEFSHQIVFPSKLKNNNGDNLNNRGDVTIFINGFPIIQIELKKITNDVGEAFKQIYRYKKESFDNSIFKTLQLFIISNDSITKYIANNEYWRNRNFVIRNDLFEWTDNKNKKFDNLIDFADSFLNTNTIFKLLTNYAVINLVDERIMILRPYQYYAVESIINKINNTNELNNTINDLDERSKLNGFIWHATGSGKTLTSFKTAQILSKFENIQKVIFLVDRLDLNDQTIMEFKKFLGEDHDNLEQTKNSQNLISQLIDPTKKIIVTTMQKMDRVLKNNIFLKKNKDYLSKNFIFIIDECHRTQFGEMHKLIRQVFCRSRFFGFTGTPIFPHNDKNGMITKDVFGENIHQYLTKDAIFDGNVLPFKIEYIKGPKNILKPGNDIEVDGIDVGSYFSSDKYIEKIADYIHQKNPQLTSNNNFKSMLIVEDIPSAIKYYWMFRKKYNDINVATLFSNNLDSQGITNEKNINNEVPKFQKEEYIKIIQDYNKVYCENCSIDNFAGYSSNIQNKLKEKNQNINIIIVVRMLTTGFDSKYINTIYLDRSLKYHELIQTISRANRIFDASKSYANVVSFKTFKKDVDKAIALYNASESSDIILVKDSLDELYLKVNEEIKKMRNEWPNPIDAKNEISEIRQKDFINYIKSINKTISLCKNFIEFDMGKINISIYDLEKYRNIYNQLRQKINNQIIKSDILEDIDFELEIIHSDEINVDYIISTLDSLKDYVNSNIFEIKINEIMEKISKQSSSSKAKLLEMFIQKWKEKMMENDEEWKDKGVANAYHDFKWSSIKYKIQEFADHNNLDSQILEEVYLKKEREEKEIEYYSEMIRKSIKEKLSYIDRKKQNKENLIKEFLININNDFWFNNLDNEKTKRK